MDLATILKAVELAGEFTPAAMRLYEGFITLTGGATQAELQARYAAARAHSDALHGRVQEAFNA